MSLKVKAFKSFSWTAFEMIFSQGIIFIVGVILARILSPEDFGIIGIITVFIAIANTIVDGGFGSALLRKLDADDNDYNTVFLTNLIVSILLYTILFLSAQSLAIFFDIPILNKVLKYSGVVLILNALSMVQGTILTKNLNFKILALISIFASVISGIVAIILANYGFGIWSLVFLTILRPTIRSVLLWLQNSWKPSLYFNKNSFKNLFDYGYKVLIARVINTIYKNIYYVLIGKFFNPASLGYYTRAEQFQAPVAGNITAAVGKISFPILAAFQNDVKNLKQKFIQFLRFSVFLNFTCMSLIAAMAESIILFLIGEKWETSILYLQLLCLPGMLYPLQIIHINLLLIKGYSNLNLRLEIIKKLILLPLVIVTAFYSIEFMLYGLILFSVIEYFINSFYTRTILSYSIKNQIVDLLPFLSISILIFGIVYPISYLKLDPFLMLILQLVTGFVVFFLVNEITNIKEYKEMKTRLLDYLRLIKIKKG